MRRVLIFAATATALAGCSSSTPTGAPATKSVATSSSLVVATSAPPAVDTSTSQPVTPAETCATPLPDRGDIIEWQREPGLPDSAIELGGTDPEHCKWTFDTLKDSSPTGSGYCTEAAWASDNVGYDPNATPAPRLKKVQVVIGDCG